MMAADQTVLMQLIRYSAVVQLSNKNLQGGVAAADSMLTVSCARMT